MTLPQAATLATDRFVLRELTPADATPTYLGWFDNATTARYITSAARMQELSALREYISARRGRDDVWFLGIFDGETGAHIGNIKYEPVDTRLGYAVMGILIGAAEARGRGVTGEVLRATGAWLKAHRGIREIVLGVDDDNTAAIRAYTKVGFVMGPTPHIPLTTNGVSTMIWTL